MTHTDTTAMTTREIAIDVLQKQAVLHQARKAYSDYHATAPKTPTGRLTKLAKQTLENLENDCSKARKALLDAENSLASSIHSDALANAGITRHNTLSTLTSLFAGCSLATAEWSDAEAAYAAQKKKEGYEGYTNGRVIVLEVDKDNPAFKGVRSRVGYGDRARDEVNDHVAHLWLHLDETGNISRAKLFAGARVNPADGERWSSYPLEDQFGIDLERHTNELSISTFNGTSSQVRAWAAKVALAADCFDKLTPLLNSSRKANTWNSDLCKVAKEILSEVA